MMVLSIFFSFTFIWRVGESNSGCADYLLLQGVSMRRAKNPAVGLLEEPQGDIIYTECGEIGIYGAGRYGNLPAV